MHLPVTSPLNLRSFQVWDVNFSSTMIGTEGDLLTCNGGETVFVLCAGDESAHVSMATDTHRFLNA